MYENGATGGKPESNPNEQEATQHRRILARKKTVAHEGTYYLKSSGHSCYPVFVYIETGAKKPYKDI